MHPPTAAAPAAVTVIRIVPAARERVTVCLSDGRRLLLAASSRAELGLAVGDVADGDLLERRSAADAAEAAALRLLSLRPRSRADLTRRLQARFGAEAADRAVGRVSGYLDDAAFAQGWVEAQARRRPSGRATLLAGLLAQGVPAAVARAALAGWEETAALADATARIERRLTGLAPQVAARRLAAALGRRGFAPDAIRGVLERRARDRCGAQRDDSDRGGRGDA